MSRSVSILIEAMKQGDPQAVNALAQRYFDELVRVASRQLQQKGVPQHLADGDDIAVSVLQSFFRVAQGRGFPELNDRGNMSKLLAKFAASKVGDALKRFRAERRGGGRVISAHDLDGSQDMIGLDRLPGADPTPDDIAVAAAGVQLLIDVLDDEALRSIALMCLENFKNREIAAALHCSLATVERKLKLIRMIWTSHGYGPPDDPAG